MVKKSIFRRNANNYLTHTKGEAGITLVALVVTVVVLLILAGITITYVLGDNSIFKLAQDAKNKTEEAIRNEQGDFANLQNYMNEAINGIGQSLQPMVGHRTKQALLMEQSH